RSTTGYYTQLGGALISWKTNKQRVVSRSSAEAEYRVMPTTISEVIWIRQLLPDLCVPSKEPTRLLCDNQTTLHIVSNFVFHERTKHVEMNCRS
ncbi:Retrovirus-related Pol polyprotein from transposon RE2, partial [Linum grandiflorum]